MFFNNYFLFISVLSAFCVCEGIILCENGFCSNFLADVGCPSTSQVCRINNATHTGISLLSPTMCNCCEYCLPMYAEGQPCSLGGAGDGVVVGRCGDGLTCVAEVDGNYCRRMPATESECHAQQDDYDSRHQLGLTGALELRPACDGKGKYAHYHCIPTQTCFCQSEDGERLFGEVPYHGSSTIQNMNCGCSRLNHQIRKSISAGVPFPVIGPRCTADGNFNPMQCLDRTCYCVDRITGSIRGDDRVDLNEESLSRLPCYEPQYDLFSRFYEDELPYNYTSPCIDEMRQQMDLMLQSEEDGYIVDYFSSVSECLPDGTYGRVSRNINGTKICVNEWGEKLGDYEATPHTTEYDNMDCRCAQTSEVMEGSLEKPVCCRNGNFRPIQCRRGNCRCVDNEGRQTSQERTDVTQLPCYSEDWRVC